QLRRTPGGRNGKVRRGGKGGLERRFAGRIVDLANQIPASMRCEVKDLRGAKVTVGDRENVARGGVGARPVVEGQIFDLVRTFLAANGAEQVPAFVEADDGRVLDRETRILGPLGGGQQRRTDNPPEVALEERLQRR